MPNKHIDSIKLDRDTQDKRVKIPLSEHEYIRKQHFEKHAGIRELAREYSVDKKLIQLILFPERLARHKELFRLRSLDGRYINREQLTRCARELRRRKHMLYGKHTKRCTHDKDGNYPIKK